MVNDFMQTVDSIACLRWSDTGARHFACKTRQLARSLKVCASRKGRVKSVELCEAVQSQLAQMHVVVHAVLFCLSHCGWRAARVNHLRVKPLLLSFGRENDCSGQRMRLVGLCEQVGRMV
jgi:hypothetical protein